MKQRLEGRGTDTPEVIRTRLENAVGEMEQQKYYDHVVVNDRLEEAVQALSDIVAQAIGDA